MSINTIQQFGPSDYNNFLFEQQVEREFPGYWSDISQMYYYTYGGYCRARMSHKDQDILDDHEIRQEVKKRRMREEKRRLAKRIVPSETRGPLPPVRFVPKPKVTAPKKLISCFELEENITPLAPAYVRPRSEIKPAFSAEDVARERLYILSAPLIDDKKYEGDYYNTIGLYYDEETCMYYNDAKYLDPELIASFRRLPNGSFCYRSGAFPHMTTFGDLPP